MRIRPVLQSEKKKTVLFEVSKMWRVFESYLDIDEVIVKTEN